MTQLIETANGPIEAVIRGDKGQWVLYFHGGHESAAVALVTDVYTEPRFRVLALSRPGYGHTRVGNLSPVDFCPLVDEVRCKLGIGAFRAVVGVSFGGPQAVAYASRHSEHTQALILHSAAPSTEPYPDSLPQRLLGPIVFHPTWSG